MSRDQKADAMAEARREATYFVYGRPNPMPATWPDRGEEIIQCQHCRFWYRLTYEHGPPVRSFNDKHNMGECRRHPPTIPAQYPPPVYPAEFPATTETMWCGMFEGTL